MNISEQYVCTACGFNAIGSMPKRCRFCGATQESFLSTEECSAKYKVQYTPVNDKVKRLKSFPNLGYEHAAYQIETGERVIWIDCPSSFDTSVAPMDYILFTHSDFLGASNLYRQHFNSQVWIHQRDAVHPNSRLFSFDRLFEDNFQISGVEAIPIGGHTPGFTIYLFEDVLFVCDFVYSAGDRLVWNAYSNKPKTRLVGQKLPDLLKERAISTVCDVSDAWKYKIWKKMLDELVDREASKSEI
ncbi:MAG: MBL fold metallo-hydrolase [Hydrococcus sp. Prado102]|jgi:hypothetical protein|nr:MBL fold metallo-hydrolase [Hydrococcus sp. Prado102]